jgi:protein required for attachment to host cells
MNVTWILVCDSAKARFFEIRESDPTWHKVSETSHDESRSKAKDLVTDQSGARSAEGGGVHHNALAPSSSPKDVEKAHFAHALGKTLDQAMRSARFGHWVLVAPSHFVGLVKKELTPELEKHLMTAVDKDFTHLTASELQDRLGDVVRIPLDQQDVIRIREPNKHAH